MMDAWDERDDEWYEWVNREVNPGKAEWAEWIDRKLDSGTVEDDDLITLAQLYDSRDDADAIAALAAATALLNLEKLNPSAAALLNPPLWLEGTPPMTSRQYEQYLRRKIITVATYCWRGIGRKGKPGWNNKFGEWGGPVTELILEIFEFAGVDEENWPKRSAIREDMKILGLV